MHARFLAAAALSTVLLTGCSSFAGDGPTTSSTSAPATTTSTSGGQPADDVPDAAPIPTSTPDGARSGPDLAYAAMTAFVDHSGDADAWFARLLPYLSTQAQDQIAGTDPANIPATVLIGAPAVVEATDFLQRLDQPTDAGTYRVLLSRALDGSWQVEAITPQSDGPTT